MENVVRLVKKQGTGIVAPLSPQQGYDLEQKRATTERVLEPRLQLMKKDGYVRVIKGIHAGKYGILTKSNSGKFEVNEYL